MTQFAPVSPDALIEQITERILTASGRLVIAVDGADSADPIALARKVSDRVRTSGRSCDAVSMHDFVRPASLRLEYGHTDELSYRTAWFDYDALRREVIGALRNDGRWLPALWDETTDRSARTPVRRADDDTILIVAGPMLLGRNLNFDLTIQLHQTPNALQRGTEPTERWTIAALQEHERTVTDEPDVLVRWDHPDRPAVRV